MLYGLVRAILASFLPFLPVIFRPEKTNDWTWARTLAGNLAPQYLSPAPSSSNNISSDPGRFAHDLDHTLTIGSFPSIGKHIDATHPIFDALAALYHHFSPGFQVPSLWQIIHDTILLLVPLLLWTSVIGLARLYKRFSLSEQTVIETIPVAEKELRIPVSQCLPEAPSSSRPTSEQESSSSLSVVVSHPGSLLDVRASPVSLANADTTSQLPSGEEDANIPDTALGSEGSSPSLIDTIARSESKGQAILAGQTLRRVFSLDSGRMHTTSPRSISSHRAYSPPRALPGDRVPSPQGLRDLAVRPPASSQELALSGESPKATPEATQEPSLASLPMGSVVTSQSTLPPQSPSVRRAENAPSRVRQPSTSRSRRASSILVSRTGIAGRQMSLTTAGIQYAASQLRSNAAPGTSVREERRRLEQVANNAALVFSEGRGAPRPQRSVVRERASSEAPADRLRRDIFDGQRNPPLANDVQSRRPVYEIGRSRSGTGAHATSMVLLERSASSVTSASRVVSSASSTTSSRQRSISEQIPSPAPSSMHIHAHPVRPLSYAAALAKPAPRQAQAPPPPPSAQQTVPAQPLPAISGPKRRTLSIQPAPSTPITQRPAAPERRIHPSLHPPPSAEESSQATPAPTGSWRTRHTSDAENWRVRRLTTDNDRALNSEFVPTPPPPMPAAFVRTFGGPSMRSVVERSHLRDLRLRAQERADIVPGPSAETSEWWRPTEGEARGRVVRPLPRRARDVFAEDQGEETEEGVRRDSCEAVVADANMAAPSTSNHVPVAGQTPDVDRVEARSESQPGSTADTDSEDDEVLLFAAERRASGAFTFRCDAPQVSWTSPAQDTPVHAMQVAARTASRDENAAPSSSNTASSSSANANSDRPLEPLVFKPGSSQVHDTPRTVSRMHDFFARLQAQRLANSVEQAPVSAPTGPSGTEEAQVQPAEGPSALGWRSRILQSLSMNMSAALSRSSVGSGISESGSTVPSRSPESVTAAVPLAGTHDGDNQGSTRTGDGSGSEDEGTLCLSPACSEATAIAGVELSASDFAEPTAAGAGTGTGALVLRGSGVSQSPFQASRVSSALISGVVDSPVTSWRSRVEARNQEVASRVRVAQAVRPPPAFQTVSRQPRQPRVRRSTAPAGLLSNADRIAALEEELDGPLTVSRRGRRPSKVPLVVPPVVSSARSRAPSASTSQNAIKAPIARTLRYDPWEFEEGSSRVDGGVTNRGHQAIPNALAKHLGGARTRAKTAQGVVGEGWGGVVARKRGITGGRFDVLESEVILE
ncbi:hypothetical protein C8Q77DRAFT_1161082 [Trametes polyzona]|nr:hypothetical protein C8Q77DRAFT_1161082 [Trametes polyzona]